MKWVYFPTQNTAPPNHLPIYLLFLSVHLSIHPNRRSRRRHAIEKALHMPTYHHQSLWECNRSFVGRSGSFPNTIKFNEHMNWKVNGRNFVDLLRGKYIVIAESNRELGTFCQCVGVFFFSTCVFENAIYLNKTWSELSFQFFFSPSSSCFAFNWQ